MIRVYISGKISDLELEKAIEKFENSESFLESIGMEPINPLKEVLKLIPQWKIENPEITEREIWEKAMIICIELLFKCNAIYMQSDWFDSKGAKIEKYIAEQKGMMVLYESNIRLRENEKINRIKDAVEYVTGLKFEQYTTRSKKNNLYFARIIFVHHCLENNNLSIEDVATLVERDNTSIERNRKSYFYELRCNPKFRKTTERVNQLLINNVSQ